MRTTRTFTGQDAPNRRRRRMSLSTAAGGWHLRVGWQQVSQRLRSRHGVFFFLFCFFFWTFFRQAAVKQGETRDRSLRARRPTGVGQDIALQRRAGVRVANVGGELAGARSERSLRCDCEHLPPPAPVRGCDRRALRRWAGESSALRDAVEEGLSLLAPSPSNFEGQHRQATPPSSLKLRVGYPMVGVGRGSQGEAGLVVGARSAAPVTPKRADERHIIGQWQPEVQVAEEDVGQDPSSRLPADARRSREQARRTSTPAVGQAARWPLSSSRAPPQRQARASSRRRRRRSTQRKVSSCSVNSSRVGSAVRARLPPGPAWESSKF